VFLRPWGGQKWLLGPLQSNMCHIVVNVDTPGSCTKPKDN
jgi:hypothetical protein